ncbi:MAG: hypothetical protein HPM95_06220 [Alphaproteobacteria bacterium]|nr:hypothetical protein [Alphaproteobacteria bacterium]
MKRLLTALGALFLTVAPVAAADLQVTDVAVGSGAEAVPARRSRCITPAG